MSARLDQRRDQLETDIKSALNFLHGTDLVVKLMQAADSYAGKCCEAAATTEREKIRAAIAGEYGPSEARKMRRVLLGDAQ